MVQSLRVLLTRWAPQRTIGGCEIVNNYRSFPQRVGRTGVKPRLAVILSMCLAIASQAVPSSYAETQGDVRIKQLTDKKNKLGKQKDPEDRAESLIEIASITLTYVSEAILQNDFPKLKSYIEEYRQSVRNARDVMLDSRLDSYKRPKGYKAIELTTRVHLRVLTDSMRRLSSENRQPVEEAIEEVTKIRSEMLRVLFP
jgi:hypothetical protein